MNEIYFQPSRKINLNITVRDLRNNSGGLSYYKAFTPQKIGKYCLLLPIMKSSFIGYFIGLESKERKKGSVTKSECSF